MAEEDLIFGKNRHFFGGIEPSVMTVFKASKSTDSNGNYAISIIASLPNDTVVGSQLLCTVAGAVIVRREDRYPKDEFDGAVIANVTSSQTIIDTDVTDGRAYYYSAFPYSDQGVYNRDDSNRTNIDGNVYEYLFGYDLDIEDSNPATRVSYPSDVDNYGYTAAAMDYSSGVFNYGDWPSKPGEKFMPSPCILKKNGTVDHYLNPNDYSKKVDSSASSVADSSFEGNAMMEWPKIYTKRWEEDGVYHFRCSDAKLDDDYECWCNYDINNNEINHFYTAIYISSRVNSVLRSLSGLTPAGDNILSSEFSQAMANGDGWHIEPFADRLLIQDLLVMMGKSTDGQTVYGTGISSTKKNTSGTMNDKGLFWGTSDSSVGVKIFGMEHWWGNHSRYLAGWLFTSSGVKYKITRGIKDGSAATDYNLTGSDYMDVTGAGFPVGTYYIKSFLTTPYGRIPKSSGSGPSSSTYECDAFVLASNRPSPAVVGSSGGNVEGGPFSAAFTSSTSGSSGYTTAALSCKPTLS